MQHLPLLLKHRERQVSRLQALVDRLVIVDRDLRLIDLRSGQRAVAFRQSSKGCRLGHGTAAETPWCIVLLHSRPQRTAARCNWPLQQGKQRSALVDHLLTGGCHAADRREVPAGDGHTTAQRTTKPGAQQKD